MYMYIIHGCISTAAVNSDLWAAHREANSCWDTHRKSSSDILVPPCIHLTRLGLT